MQARGQSDVPYYSNPNAGQRQLCASERLPSLHLAQPQQTYSSSGSSPRVSSISSIASSHLGSQSSYTSAQSSNGPKTPGTLSPTITPSIGLPGQHGQALTGYDHYPAMNQPGTEMYYQHMSSGPAPQPQTVTSYSHQPPLLQPGPGQYPPPQSAAYPHYSYPNGITPQNGPPAVSASNVLPLPQLGNQQGMAGPYQPASNYDTTGQVAPAGMKPRVTATLWEDEGSLCFQVEAKGICVARREDNHMINGTKLLNVAGMTRGRRDGILKSEKIRHVVKIGPMHLKGVWIPFERALDFANKEKITELLYPLFVHNIGALLCHPTNQNRANPVMAAAERRKQENNQMRNTQSAGGLPSLQQHHHHSMGLPGPQPPLPSHPNMGRPSLDRAHTFPTPPTTASGVMGAMGSSDNFQWGHQGMNGTQGANHMSMDARSMPTTPATTPPGTALQSMQSYPPASQAYDSSRQLYSAPSAAQHSAYPSANPSAQDRSIYGQTGYVKNEMGPPASRSVGSMDQSDPKAPTGMMHPGQGGEPVPQPGAEEEAEHDHDAEYTHDSGAYDANRAQYNYNPPPVATLPNDHAHLTTEMAGSPHQGGSGRATPRTAPAPQSYYGQPGYSTPPRAQPPSSTLYNVMSSDRPSTGAATGADVYAPQADMGSSIANGYASQQAVMNGGSGGVKRGRDDEDDRPTTLDPKRRKTFNDGSISSPTFDASMSRPSSAIATQRRR